MGVRGELFSTKVALDNRTYFFNVKENRLGDLYLNIVESKNREEGGFERQSVILFAEDLQDFLSGFDESLKVLEKAAREKKRPKAPSSSRTRERGDRPPFKSEREPRSGRPPGEPPSGRRPERVTERRPDRAGGRFSNRRSDEETGYKRPVSQRRNERRSQEPPWQKEQWSNERPVGRTRERFHEKEKAPLRKKKVVVKKH
jgi:hypothetical protein